jgi:predicted nucleotide-binding protein (sugar kinase/HSP70/actin superfamily)
VIAGRTLLVGGLSSVHDPLCAAALCGLGEPAEALHARTNEGLARARALGNHGQCNPAHYAVGAVLEHARRSGETPEAFAQRYGWLTVGSCGPCRLAAFGFEYARVLRGAGLGDLPVLFVEQVAFAHAPTSGGLARLDAGPAEALRDAIVAGDVLAALGRTLWPYAVDDREVDALLEEGLATLVACFEARCSPLPTLAALGARGRAIPRDLSRVLPRVLFVGEPWTTLADGDPSYDLARRLARSGVEVLATSATDWLLHRLWEEEGRAADRSHREAFQHGTARLRATWRAYADAAGVRQELDDPAALAAIAAPHYAPDVKGGSAHLEVARALAAAGHRAAHLVLSLKPFGCLPSSSLSDGILSVLARDRLGLRFLAVETTGDADATAESRVEMAIHAAALAAVDELATSAERAGLSAASAVRLLESLPAHRALPEGPRTYACTAAELVARMART